MHDEDFDSGLENPSGSRFSQIVGGILVPFGLAVWGTTAIVTREARLRSFSRFGGGGQSLQIHGTDAILFGAALIAFGVVAHVHFRWPFSRRLYRWADPVKTLAALVGVGTLIVMVVRVALWG